MRVLGSRVVLMSADTYTHYNVDKAAEVRLTYTDMYSNM